MEAENLGFCESGCFLMATRRPSCGCMITSNYIEYGKKIFHQLLLSVTLGNTLSLWAQLLVGDFYNKLKFLFCHTGELFRVILAGSPSDPTHPVAKHQDNESKL